jgi:beta-lactamase class A
MMHIKPRHRRRRYTFLRWVSVLLLLAAGGIGGYQFVRYALLRSTFPPGSTIASLPVGGLTPQQAAGRVSQVYTLPLELHYRGALIQVRPADLGFELDLDATMAPAELEQVYHSLWNGFWDYLWNRLPGAVHIPLRFKISEDQLRTYLQTEIIPRYDELPSAAFPLAGTTRFQPGRAGAVLQVEPAIPLIEHALQSSTVRRVDLTFEPVGALKPSLENLRVQLRQLIDVSKFDGVTELYFQDLQTGQEIHFAYRQGRFVPSDIAFTAASTIKIPIMVAVFRRTPEPTPDNMATLLTNMIDVSENYAADQLMATVLDKKLGPLEVTQDAASLGLTNTFLAGYFAPGSPLLRKIDTPGNLRADVKTGPDPYNQTNPADLGMLLDDIYQCAQSGGGALAAVFPGQFSQSKCKQMIDLLLKNKLPTLITAGLPEGTPIAHKHGWIVESDGLLHTLGDAAIVYTPKGNFVLSIFLYQPTQLLFDPANNLIADLTQASYNYFNQ